MCRTVIQRAVGRDLSAIMVLMLVNQVDTAFEYAVIFVCWIIWGQSTAQGAQLLYDYASKHSY